jgi:hypothetical protein
VIRAAAGKAADRLDIGHILRDRERREASSGRRRRRCELSAQDTRTLAASGAPNARHRSAMARHRPLGSAGGQALLTTALSEGIPAGEQASSQG